MGRNKHKKNYWEDIPDALRYLCLAHQHTSDSCCTKAALNFLLEESDCDSFLGATPYEFLIWTDKAIEEFLYPLELRDDDWALYKDDISKVLVKAESMLAKIGPADLKDGYILSYLHHNGMDLVKISQKLDVYLSTLYMYTNDFDKLKDQLNQLLKDSKQNVQNLLNYSDAYKLISRDEIEEYHYPGTDVLQPLNMLVKQFIPGGQAKKQFIQTYEQYVLFLKEQSDHSMRKKAALHMYHRAEQYLRNMCDSATDEIIDICNDDPELPLQLHQDYEKDRLMYEKIIDESRERESSLNNKSDGIGNSNNEYVLPEQYYHKTRGDFTRKLHRLMDEYPGLPVVVCSLSQNKNLTCDICYVHDKKTDDFKEKIIAIYEGKNNTQTDSECFDFSDEDVPF